jgi:hypothetical protein
MNEEVIAVQPEIAEIPVKKAKKKGGCLKKLLIFLLIVTIGVLVASYYLPGLLWSKSLGISYSKADYDSFMTKIGYTKDDIPSGDLSEYEYVYGPVKNVNVSLTSEEITAFFNEGRPDNYAIKNVQVRINSDGTIEAVASASVDYFLQEFLNGEYTRDDIKNEIPVLGWLPSSVNLYMKVDGMISDNESSIAIYDVSVQGIPLPSSMVKSADAKEFLTSGIDKLLSVSNEKSDTYFEKLAVENSGLTLKGQIPSSLERVKISD